MCVGSVSFQPATENFQLCFSPISVVLPFEEPTAFAFLGIRRILTSKSPPEPSLFVSSIQHGHRFEVWRTPQGAQCAHCAGDEECVRQVVGEVVWFLGTACGFQVCGCGGEAFAYVPDQQCTDFHFTVGPVHEGKGGQDGGECGCGDGRPAFARGAGDYDCGIAVHGDGQKADCQGGW